ncbi:MAG: RNA polymerase subunit sigma [Pseudonocardia sp.]|nr:RNA polymerase subunit sigma [Pseudonocardia sp.]
MRSYKSSQLYDDAAVTSLALAAGRGDTESLAEFVRATQGDVQRFLTYLTGQRDIEDLAQETYMRAIPNLPSFAGRASARTWLLSVARRVAADAVRTAVRRPRTCSPDRWEGPACSGEYEAVLLWELVDGLAPERREAFVLTQVLEVSYATAADISGCPVGTIRSRVARAREDIIRAYDGDRFVGPTGKPYLYVSDRRTA